MKNKLNVLVIGELQNGNDAILKTVILALWDRQTQDEQSERKTKYVNSRGVYQRDVAVLTAAVVTLLSGKNLNAALKAQARKRVLRYRRQVSEIAEEKGITVTRPVATPVSPVFVG